MLARFIDALRRLLRLLDSVASARQRVQSGSPPPLGASPIGEAVGKPGPTPPAPPPPPPPPPPAPPPAEGMLALPQLMAIAGAFPQRVGGEPANYTLGMIQSFAGRSGAYGAPPADGRLLPVPDNQPLMAVIGLTFGGDGLRLALPDLRSRAPIGGQQIGLPGQHSLGMTYLIATAAESGAPMLGMVVAFGGNFAPPGWTVADGRMLPISANVPLYQLIGQIFGGSPVAFNLPNLHGFAVIGAGGGPGLEPIALGGHVAQPVPALALNYLINIDAAAPPGGGTGGFPESGSWLGQVIAYAGSDMPLGWAACDGALLDAATYPALFALLGTQYGGDASRFALPDLRGRILIGA